VVFLVLSFWGIITGESVAQAFDRSQQFLKGYQYIQDHQYGEVIDLWSEEIQWGPLEDYVFYYLAQAYEGLNLCEKGYELYEKVTTQHPKSLFYWPSVKGMGTEALCLGNLAKAREFLHRYLKNAPHPGDTSEIKFLLALSYDVPGERQKYHQELKLLWQTEPQNQWTQLVYNFLNEDKISIKDADYQKKAHELLDKKYYEEALSLFKKWGEGNYRGEIAECYYGLRQYKTAQTLFEELYNNGIHREKALGRLATLAVRLGDNEKGIALNDKIIRLYRQGPLVYEARRKLAFLYRDIFQFQKAIQELNILLSTRPSAQWKRRYLKNIAWNYYRLGKMGDPEAYQSAIKHWEDLIYISQDQEKILQQAYYWRGRVFAELGQQEAAQKEWTQLAEAYPWTYYGFLALKSLYPREEDFKSAFSRWIQLHYVNIQWITEPKNQSFSYGYHYPRYLILSELRLGKEAQNELMASYEELNGELQLAPLVVMARDAAKRGNFYFPFRVGISLWHSYESEDRTLLYWAYPKAYVKSVTQYARKFLLDPFLMYAVMRQESHFRPNIVSSAGARGLLQIMPETGRRLAKGLQWRHFDPDLLFYPEKNIALSSYYLDRLLDEFGRDLVSILASYNAGESAVRRWKKGRENLLPEEFAEEIPYEETNNYVKKVLENYWLYRSLYQQPNKNKEPQKSTDPVLVWKDISNK